MNAPQAGAGEDPQGGEGSDAGMGAMDRLKAARNLARATEMRELDGLRYELEQVIGKKEDSGEGFIDRIRSLSPRKLALWAGVGIGGPVLAAVLWFVWTALIPGRLLGEYESALEDGDLSSAVTALDRYLAIESEDWERLAQQGQLLMRIGDHERGRNVYAKLINNSPLRDDLDIQYLSAMSYLPRLNTTKGKMAEVLVSGEDYLPALVARALLEDNDSETANRDIDEALRVFAGLRKGGETYQRYQDFVSMFIVNLCRTDEPFISTLSPGFDLYPADLRGSDLLVYGMDASLKLDICVVVPTEISADGFNPDLGLSLYALKTFIAILDENYDTAVQSISESTAIQSVPFNAYIEALLLTFIGEFQNSETAFLRTGIGSADVLVSRNISNMLRGSEHWEEATALLDEALQEDPNHAQALNNRAVISMLNARYGKARSDLEQALSVRNFYIHAVFNSAIVELLSGDPEVALNKFNTLSGTEEFFPGINYYVGQTFSGLGEEDKAVALWRNSVDNPGYGALSNIALGDVFAREPLGYETALGFYETALDIDDKNIEAAVKLARMKALLDDSQGALSDIDEIEETLESEEYRNVDYFRELAQTVKGEILFITDDPDATQELAAAFDTIKDIGLYKQITDLYIKQLLKVGDTRVALEASRNALPTDPTDLTLRIARARALAAFGDIPEAIEIITDTEREHPEDTGLLDVKAEVLAKDQRWQEAADIYLRIFDILPGDTAPLDKARELLEQYEPDSPKLAEVYEVLERATYKPEQEALTSADNPENVIIDQAEVDRVNAEITEMTSLIEQEMVSKFSGFSYLGYLHSQIGNIADAQDNYKVALTFEAEDPGNVWQVWQGLASTYILASQFQEALDALNESIDNNPPTKDLTNIIMTRAGIKEKLGLAEEAIADYDFVTENFPSFTQPFMRRSLLYLSLNRPEDAVSELSTIIRLEPENLEAYRARHNAYNLIGDSAKASQDAKTIQLLEEKKQRERAQAGGA